MNFQPYIFIIKTNLSHEVNKLYGRHQYSSSDTHKVALYHPTVELSISFNFKRTCINK